MTCVRARHDGRRRELCRLLLTHGVGDDEVVPTHPGKCRHVSERAGGVDVGEHSLVRRRQIAAEHGGKRERALRRVRKVHGNRLLIPKEKGNSPLPAAAVSLLQLQDYREEQRQRRGQVQRQPRIS